MTYSIDFRKKVLKAKAKEGLSFEKVAARFCVSKAAVVIDGARTLKALTKEINLGKN
jgi:transposase